MPALALVPEEPVEPGYDFGESFQSKIVAFLMLDTKFAQRTEGLIDPLYFTSASDAAIVSVCLKHYATYKEAPRSTLAHVFKKAFDTKQIRADLKADVRDTLRKYMKNPLEDREVVIDEISDFAKNRAMERAIMASAELVGKKDYAKIRKLMDEALRVGSASDAVSYDYWKEASNRTTLRKELLSGVKVRDGITTGVDDFDKLLYHHGWGRKELAVLMGAPKAGKSLALADFAKVASMAGKNVILFSCEVSARIIADRVDASVSDMMIKIIGDNPIAVQAAVDAAAKQSGAFAIEEYASGSLKASEIRRVLDRFRSTGTIFDLIVVDYGDLMAPERHSDELRENLRTIFIDLRAIAFENNAAMLTATQTNREGAKSAISKMTDVAEDFNKIRTADVVISINSTDAERLAGETRLFFAASRNTESGYVLRIKGDRAKMQFLNKVIGKEAF
jgi:replicative DNA helicase